MHQFSCALTAIVAGALLGIVNAHAAETLKLTTGEFTPFVGEKLPEGGPLAEVVKRAFAESGYQGTLEFLPWKRGYAETKVLRYDVTFPYAKTPEREGEFLYSELLYAADRRIYTTGGWTANIDELQSLKGKIYCLPLGYSAVKELSPLLEAKEIEVTTPPDLSNCAKMIVVGRADFLIASPDIVESVLERAGLQGKLKPSEKSFGKSEYYVIVSKTHPKAKALIAAFNKGITTLRARGEVDKIVKKGMQ